MLCTSVRCGREAAYRSVSVWPEPIVTVCVRCMELYRDTGVPDELWLSLPERKRR